MTEAEIGAFETNAVSEQDLAQALGRLDSIWDELFPAEQNRIVELLVGRVEVRENGLEVRLRDHGLRSLVAELGREKLNERAK